MRTSVLLVSLLSPSLVACSGAEADLDDASSTGVEEPGVYAPALDDVIATIDAVHRSTLDGRSPALEAAVAAARAEVDQVDTDAEFELLVGRVLVALGDGHSTVGLRAGAPVASIDLPIAWLDEGPVVARATDVLKPGDAIVSIGGRSADTILADLAAHVSRDGDAYLRHAGPRRVPRQDWLEPMGMIEDGRVTVAIERDGEQLSFDLPLEDGLVVDPAPQRATVGWTIEAEHDLGVFHLDACVYDANYQATLAAFMAEVHAQDVGKIAIDLRFNGGGDVTVAYAFVAWLAPEVASFSVSARRSDALVEQAPIYADPSFLGLLEAFGVALDGPTFEVPGAALSTGIGALVPAVAPEQRFTGDVYVLVSPTTYSSAQLFVGEIVDNGLGVTVGDETGALRNSTGDMLSFDVPDTDVAFTLAGSWMTRPVPELGQGPTLADIPIRVTRADIAAGRDPVLDAVRMR
ncbi:MAG: hypothetical protein IPK74_32375 [Deltaproteobacteria bacterium]|nr:hypothetical protein [Deltaproteobacteria bacterium]